MRVKKTIRDGPDVRVPVSKMKKGKMFPNPKIRPCIQVLTYTNGTAESIMSNGHMQMYIVTEQQPSPLLVASLNEGQEPAKRHADVKYLSWPAG